MTAFCGWFAMDELKRLHASKGPYISHLLILTSAPLFFSSRRCNSFGCFASEVRAMLAHTDKLEKQVCHSFISSNCNVLKHSSVFSFFSSKIKQLRRESKENYRVKMIKNFKVVLSSASLQTLLCSPPAHLNLYTTH